jgi:tetratricopeptide (TPR) repeat protein
MVHNGAMSERRRTESSGCDDRGLWVAVLVVLAAGALAYSNSFAGVFVFDGRPTLRDNLQIRSLSPFWPLITSPLDGSTAAGRPVANLLSAVNWAMADGALWPFHLSNLAVHLIAALLLLGIVRRTVPLIGADEATRRAATLIAGAAASLWVVHPLTTSAVTYINQRVESLMAMFVLATLYLVIRSTTSPQPWRWQAAAVVACLFAVASKEVAVVTPVVVLAYDSLFLAGSVRAALTRRWKLHLLLAATWVPLAVLVAGTSGRGGTAGFAATMGWWQYAGSQPAMITRYLRLAVWPQPLVFYYGARPFAGPAELAAGFVVVGGLGLGTVWLLARRSWLGFAGLVVLASLAPSSSVVPIATEIGAEHRMYLALTAVCATVAAGGWYLARRWSRDEARARRALTAAVGVVVMVLAGATWARNRVYASETALWTATIRVQPANVAAWDNLGHSLREERQDLDGAVRAFDRALELDPEYAESFNERGFTFALMGDPARGLRDLDRALELEPDHAAARLRRGIVRGWSGDLPGAIADFSRLIDAGVGGASAYLQRGIARLNLGDDRSALVDLERAVALEPGLAPAIEARATARLRCGDIDGARRDLGRLRELGVEPHPALVRQLEP